MKAVQITEFGGPEVLKLAEVEEPTPKENQVKVKLYATGLNPSDSYTISGTYAFNRPELPYIPGYDGAGVIEEIGSSVEKVKVGDRVFVSAFSKEDRTEITISQFIQLIDDRARAEAKADILLRMCRNGIAPEDIAGVLEKD